MEPSPLLQAASEGDLKQLEQLIAAEGTTTTDDDIQELLKTAARKSQIAIMEYLLTKYSPEINEPVVYAATQSGSETVFSLILSKNPTIINSEVDKVIGSPLAIACMEKHPLEFIKYLLNAGANPAQGSDLFYPPTTIAAGNYRDTELIDLFLERGATVEHVSALSAAAGRNNVIMVRYLVEKYGLRDDNDRRTSRSEPALHAAATRGHMEVLKILLENGEDINTKDRDDHTALEAVKIQQEETGEDLTEVMDLLNSYGKNS